MIECDSSYRVRVRRQGLHRFGSCYIPYPHSFVKSARDKEITFRVEVDTKDEISMSPEYLDGLALSEYNCPSVRLETSQ